MTSDRDFIGYGANPPEHRPRHRRALAARVSRLRLSAGTARSSKFGVQRRREFCSSIAVSRLRGCFATAKSF